MNDEWRLTTKSITKYNPIFRDKNGFYRKKDWIGLQDVGKVFDGKLLTFELYSEVEKKYIDASISFFKFHYTNKMA